MTGRVLVGMSIREVNAIRELETAATGAGARLAFLQIAEPALSTVLTELADRGVTRIELLGVCFGPLAPGLSRLRRVAAHWWRERGPEAPDVVIATVLVGADVAVPGVIDTALQSVRPVRGTEAPVTSPAWEQVPPYRRHVTVCRGPRCSARGAEQTWTALADGLTQRGLKDTEVLMCAATCMFPCNQAPVVAVQPDDVWYGRIGPAEVDELIEVHLVAGTPLDGARIR